MRAARRWIGGGLARALASLLLILAAPAARGDSDQTLTLHVGEARLVPLLAPPAQVFLDDPELAEFRLAAPTQIMLVGQRPGHAVLHALGETGAAIATIDLDVEPAAADAAPAADDREVLRAIEVSLQPNATASLPLMAAASRVFVNDPAVVAVTMTGPADLRVEAKSAGTTQVYALDDRGVRVGLFDITVGGARPAAAPTQGVRPPPMASEVSEAVQIDVDEARLIDLPRPASSAAADDPRIAGTRIQPPAKLLVYGKTGGQTFIRARDDTGAVVAIVRVDVSAAMQ